MKFLCLFGLACISEVALAGGFGYGYGGKGSAWNTVSGVDNIVDGTYNTVKG